MPPSVIACARPGHPASPFLGFSEHARPDIFITMITPSRTGAAASLGATMAPIRGRAAEWERISSGLISLESGQSQVIVLQGPPGAGKSRLLREVVAVARHSHATLLISADPLTSLIPYASLAHALESSDPPVLTRQVASQLFERPDIALALLWEVASQLEATAHERGWVCVLDDAQWADRMTISAVSQLISRTRDLPILWVIASRDGQLPAHVSAFLAELRAGGASELWLGSLSQAAVREIVVDRVAGQPDEPFMAMISKAANVPLHVHEILTGLLDEGSLRRTGDVISVTTTTVPHSLGGSIRERIAALAPDARDVVTVGAVLGRQFDLDTVAILLERSRAGLVVGAREALDSQILTPGDAVLEFAHDVGREAALALLPESLRRAIGYDYAMLRLGRGDDPLAIAQLISDSAQPGDRAAIDLLLRAARDLVAKDAFGAGALARRAVQLAAGNRDTLAGLGDLVQVLWRAGDSASARALFDELTLSTTPGHEASLRLAMARMETERSFDRAIEHCDRALRLAALTGSQRAELLAIRAMNLQNASRFDQVPKAISDAREAAVRAGSAEALATGLVVDSAFRFYGLHFDDAVALAREATTIMSTRGPRASLWLPEALWPSLLAIGIGQPLDAVVLTSDGVAEATALKDAPAIAYWKMMRSRAFLEAGRLDSALEEAAGVLELSGQLDLGLFTAVTAGTAAYRAALMKGDRIAMRESESFAEEMIAQPGPVRRTGLWLRALRADADGEVVVAADLCEEALLFLDAPAPHLTAPGDIADDVTLARILLRAGRRAEAERVVRHSQKRRALNPANSLARGIAHHTEAIVYGELSHAETAVAALRENGRPIPLASALEDLGRMAGDQSVMAWQEALSLYETTGAERSAARVRRRLRGVGVNTSRPRTAGHRQTLTATELEVARLVAERLTTAEIARELSLSPHTVVTHVRHIYSKLGIASRQELAARFGQSQIE